MYVAVNIEKDVFINKAKIRRSAIADETETAQYLKKTAYILAESTTGLKCDDLFPST
jgi:excinuclease UvrABC ATPase subunit